MAGMSNTLVEPYLFFGGRCDEALAFYASAVGARVQRVMRFKEAPNQPPEGTLAPGFEDKVMHAAFHIGGSLVMASDGCGRSSKFDGFSLSLSVATEAEADKAFNALAAGGQITMPIGKTFWSPRFGMVTDKFGVSWMVNVTV